MIKKNQRLLNNLNAVTDGLMVGVSYFLSSWLWLDVVKETSGNMADIENLHGIPLLIVCVYACWTILILALLSAWTQVNGLRGDTSIPDRVRHDLWYIEHWSLGLDIKILFKTIFGGMVNEEKVAF